MKKIIVALFCFTGILQLSAQTNFTALKITPEYPKQHDQFSFQFDKANSSLKTATVDIVVYQFTATSLKVTEPVITKKGNLYSGSFVLDSNANCIAFGISSGEEKDLNGGKGYIVPVYTEKNIPVKSYYKSASDLQNGYGQYLLGIAVDAKAAKACLEDGIRQYPDMKNDPFYLDAYLNTINRAQKKEAPVLILGELQRFESKGNLTADDYGTLIHWYARDKRMEKVDSLNAAMKAAFPDVLKKDEAMMNFRNENDPAKKLVLYQEYIKAYPPKENDGMANNFKSQMALAYANAKDYKSYEEWNQQLSKPAAASNNNNTAWEMAQGDGDIEAAKKMAFSAVSFAKAEVLKPTEKKNESLTTKQWEDQRKNNYAMYGDTYAFILYKKGEYATGLPYAKDAATFNKLKDPEYNERYALLAEKAMPLPEAKKLLEQFVKDGVASSKTKEALKNLYVREKKSDEGFTAYLDVLEASAKAKKREEIAKSIISEPSPSFTLKDFEGKAVSLAELKDKVVVVDFWATWCGPCIASMPGMNKTLTKFKDNENVKFLFVDTWETADNKLQNAKDFMTKKNYPFYVLLDTENKMVEDFKVNGIPTKFVIDKAGNIRFKAVGFSGNDDALVDELTTMIELASK